MVETSDSRQSDELGAGRGSSFKLPAFRGVADRGMDSLPVVVVDVLAEKSSQMVLTEHDDMI
jgi:hypothetical protein